MGGPQPAPRHASDADKIRLAAFDTGTTVPGWGSEWSPAPAYDDEHPDELSYRPFPVAPLLTETESADDPVLAVLTHPEIARTLELLDQQGAILPMRLRPGLAVARQLWSQEFRGGAVKAAAVFSEPEAPRTTSGLADRSVRTAAH